MGGWRGVFLELPDRNRLDCEAWSTQVRKPLGSFIPATCLHKGLASQGNLFLRAQDLLGSPSPDLFFYKVSVLLPRGHINLIAHLTWRLLTAGT